MSTIIKWIIIYFLLASCPLSWIATNLALGSSREINLVLCWMLHASTNSYYWARKCHPPTFDVLASPWRNYRWRRIILFHLAVWIRHEYWVLLCCVPQSIWKFLLIMRDWRRDLNESNWKVALQAFFTSWLENIKIISIVDDDDTGTGVIRIGAVYPKQASSIRFWPLGYLFLLTFIFLIVVVLMNLLNGLAVIDMAVIREKTEIVTYIIRVETLSFLRLFFLVILSTFCPAGQL